MVKIIIFSPSYSPDSGGIIVLHKLCDILLSLGYEAGFYVQQSVPFYTNSTYKSRGYTIQDIDLENDIVIYPEIILGNPLGGKKIIRYIMNIGHITLNRKSTWGENDQWVYYSERFYDNIKPKNLLTISDSKLDYYKDYGLDRKIEDCFTYRKQHENKEFIKKYHSSSSIEINFNCGDEYLINVFNSCKNFYCYDTESHLSILASLCGCNSIIISDIESKEKVIGSQPVLQYGVAFGVGEIEYAAQTRHLLREYLKEQEKQQVSNVDNYFIYILNLFSK